MRIPLFCLLVVFASLLAANEIGVATGDKAWFVLSDPPGESGEGLSEFAGDPGLPSPDWEVWPDGQWPATELWHYDANSRRFTQATDVLGAGEEGRVKFRRTLYAPFAVSGQVYVLHFDPYRQVLGNPGALCHVVKLDPGLREAKGTLPQAAVLLKSDHFIDAPAVSPDGSHVVFRAAVNKSWVLRVYRVSDWSLVAESEAATWARPVWVSDSGLACIAHEGAERPKFSSENPAPAKGTLRLLRLGEKLTHTPLLEGVFPLDHYSRSLAYDFSRKVLVLARKEGESLVVESRPTEPGAGARELARVDHLRGIVVDGATVFIAGVRDQAADDAKKSDRRLVTIVVRPRASRDESGEKDEFLAVARRELSTDGRGGLQDLGSGIGCYLEPVLNPLYADNQRQPSLLHTMFVLNWPGCDSMRNPRMLQLLSAQARRFKSIEDYKRTAGRRTFQDGIQSTLLAFDLDIKINDPAVKNKKARYLELYDGTAASRKGKGRIRVEDNIGGNWMVYSVHGDGKDGGDTVYDNTTVTEDGKLAATPAARSGMYEKLLGQIESRRLLILMGLEKSSEAGGLVYEGRSVWRDPITGTERRIWNYRRKGEGRQQSAQMGFIADAPYASAEMPNAHPLLVAAVVFGMGQGNVNSSVLAFDYTSYVELPDLSGNGAPSMLLPKVIRAYQRNEKGEREEQFSATLLTQFDHEVRHVRGGKIRCGFNVVGARQEKNFTDLEMGISP